MTGRISKRRRPGESEVPARQRHGPGLWLLLAVAVGGAVALFRWPPFMTQHEFPAGLNETPNGRPDALAKLADIAWEGAYRPEATAEQMREEARQVAVAIAEAYPQNTAALGVLARLHYALGECQEAIRLWQRSVEIDAGCAEAHYGLGAAALRRGDFQAALDALERAEPSMRGDPRVPPARAAAWLGLGRVAEAVAVLEQSARHGPLSTDARIVLGQAYLQRGEAENALRLFQELVQQAPQEAKAHYGLARACRLAGRIDEARQHMQRFQESQQRRVEDEFRFAHTFSGPVTSRGLLVRTLLEAAPVYAVAGDAERAERLWRSAAHLDHADVASRVRLRRLYRSQDRPREAVAMGEELCKLEPANAEHWFELGVLRGLLGQYDAALTAMDRALELDPQNARYRQAREAIVEGKGE